MDSRLSAWAERIWYERRRAPLWLRPLSALFGALVRRRRARYHSPYMQYRAPLPVIVIGNLTVGGTGKSPLTAWLVETLQAAGYHPVILTRGYGGRAPKYPLLVDAGTPVAMSGDEPLMLARQCRVPVLVDPDRARAAEWAVTRGLGNILVCDDGLQHYRLGRNLEIAVFDGERGAGNGSLLPAGPLREPLGRLSSVTTVVANGAARHPTFEWIRALAPALMTMALKPCRFRNLRDGTTVPPGHFAGRRVHGVAGIGNPERFFQTLADLGCQVSPHPFPDHHRFTAADLAWDDAPVVMTAKDSVKCEGFAGSDCWALEIVAEPDPELEALVFRALAQQT